MYELITFPFLYPSITLSYYLIHFVHSYSYHNLMIVYVKQAAILHIVVTWFCAHAHSLRWECPLGEIRRRITRILHVGERSWWHISDMIVLNMHPCKPGITKSHRIDKNLLWICLDSSETWYNQDDKPRLSWHSECFKIWRCVILFNPLDTDDC